MSFKKPFATVPVKLGPYYQAKINRERRGARRSWLLAVGGFAIALAGGMLFTHRDEVAAKAYRSSVTASCPALTVHDGDTIRCGSERIRIANIDAPELPDSPKCTDPRKHGWCDYDLGYRSRDALRALLSAQTVTIRRDGVDKYGRALATLRAGDRDVGDYLVSLGLARRWQ